MVYVIYRCLYGEDFIQESIRSIEKYVDKIFIFWDDRAWGDVTHCIYKGERVGYPVKFDNIIDKIKELNNPKIELIYDHQFNNINQFTHFVNDIILPNYEKPDEILVVEVDHVFREDQLEAAFREFRENKFVNASTSQIEVWKGFRHRVPDRPGRRGAILWDMKQLNELPMYNCLSDGDNIQFLKSYVHNFGFAVSEKVMYWKHMTALRFSQEIGDSKPNESWYEDKWLSWDFEDNNENLEISFGWEHTIPFSIPYDINELPIEILHRLKH